MASVTQWRNKQSRELYTAVQELDSHTFLAVLLAVNPSNGQLNAVEDALHKLKPYATYHFAPEEST